ncbi:MAG: TetR/AcrR family transcriptional regulator [Roseburia sp.]|nr:TetR/AcrR family transcriptional regulator [Roseburia sp.]
MGEDKATREKLLASAKEEFLEKGYMKASLRTICKKAGVTTGALYFFFQDKEDLLKNLVEEPLRGLSQIIQEHFSLELSAEPGAVPIGENSEDIKASKEVVHFMYQHYDIFQILLTKSQGSMYEDIVSRFADMFDKHYTALSDEIAKTCGVPKPDHYMIHWLTHMQIDAFIHLLTHEPKEERAVEYIEEVVIYILSGWNGLLFQKR